MNSLFNSQTTTATAIPNNNNELPKFPMFLKFQVGDFVRVPHKRNSFSKSYATNWNKEVFKLHKINSTNLVTYTLEDENKEIFQGKFYKRELLRSAFNFKSNNKTLESISIFHKFE